MLILRRKKWRRRRRSSSNMKKKKRDTLATLPYGNFTPITAAILELGAAFWNVQGGSVPFQGILKSRTFLLYYKLPLNRGCG
jgi:hypothetical protein